MEGIVVLAQGFMLGVAIAAPVGSVGLLCIRRTLEHGPAIGFATGMGAAVADGIFGAIAAFGVTAALTFLAGHETFFRLFGGAFLMVIAVRTFRAAPIAPDCAPDVRDWFTGFATGLTLTLTNPITVFAFIALFAGIGLGGRLGQFDAMTLVLGVFLGSAGWWLTLSSGVALVRHRISEERLLLINRGTAVALAVFGLWAISTGFSAIIAQAMA
ncbi:MAG: lysine transporter LysE [Azospirillum sp.]|nr:lysine transporter LysE [Azospirillum sp.]